MELTPDVLHEQEFREARRGYDMREVDEFLERVAVAVAQLLEQLKAAVGEAQANQSRIAQLESELREASKSKTEETDETLRRTLVLAQKTAESAVAEADEQAAKILGRAEQQAAFVLKEAHEVSERSRIEAEAHARQAGEETRRRMLEEITTLERTRETLSSDVRGLRRYLDDQRTRMRTAARDLQRLSDDPTALKDVTPPTPSGVSLADLDIDLDDDEADRQTTADPELGEEVEAWLSTDDWDETGKPAEVEGSAEETTDDSDFVDFGAERDLEPEAEAPMFVQDDEGGDADGDGDYFEDLRRAMDDSGESEETSEA